MTVLFTLRPATNADYSFLRELHRQTMKRYVEQTWGWNDAEQERMFRERFNPAKLRIIVYDGQDVGMVSVGADAEATWIANIQVLPEHQRNGLGTAVIESVLAEARAKRQPVNLTVLKVNPARGLYERLGFRVIGETATHYEMQTNP